MNATLKMSAGLRQPHQHRNRREEDADRAAQADPGDERDLALAVTERRKADRDRERPADSIRNAAIPSAGHSATRRARAASRAGRARGTSRSGTATCPRRAPKDAARNPARCDCRRRRRRCRPRGTRCRAAMPTAPNTNTAPATRNSAASPPDSGSLRSAAAIAMPPAAPARRADAELQRKLARERHAAEILRRREVRREQRRQQHGDRIVRARFDFERRADARAQLQSARAQQEEHRRRVGRRDDRAEQQRFDRPSPSSEMRGDAGQRRRDDDAERRQQQGRREHAAERLAPRAQAAVEQDHRERERAEPVGQLVVVEADAAGSVDAGEHADHEEHEQQRRAETARDQARADARQHQRGGAREKPVGVVDCVHAGRIIAGRAAAGGGECSRFIGLKMEFEFRMAAAPALLASSVRAFLRAETGFGFGMGDSRHEHVSVCGRA